MTLRSFLRLRAAATAAAVIVTAALSSAAYQEAAAARDRRRFLPPGRLVDVGGRRLHLLGAGEGGPAVVVVPALGDSGLIWQRIQSSLAPEVRVCLYDRAGIGWSDPLRRRRSTSGMADDLHALLAAAGVEPPYILVGHSVGGIIARRFAASYPALVAGMVLVDSSHEEQGRRLGGDGWPFGLSRLRRRAAQRQMRVLGVRRARAAFGLVGRLDADVAREVSPEHAAAYRATLLSTRQRRAVVREMLWMAGLSESPPALGSIPLTVITAGIHPTPGWGQLQDELAALSTGSSHITADGSRHYVHLDDPELVIQTIRDVVRRADSVP
jgi:pimeloyl-ACP methyl ester carboxylesterase